MCMDELKAGVRLAQFTPQPPHAKVTLADVDVVKDDDSLVRQLRLPYVKIVLDSVIRVQTVDMQEINTAVFKAGRRVIKRHSQKSGERAETARIERVKSLKDRFVVVSCLMVTTPRVDSVAAAVEAQLKDGLAERRVRYTIVSSELDKDARPAGGNNPMTKWDMSPPGTVDG